MRRLKKLHRRRLLIDKGQSKWFLMVPQAIIVPGCKGCCIASPLDADEPHLHTKVKVSCRVTEVGQMEARGDFDFEQAQALEAWQTVQRVGKH